ncbi:unnamed protein product, partial [Ranitomeya imitator]
HVRCAHTPEPRLQLGLVQASAWSHDSAAASRDGQDGCAHAGSTGVKVKSGGGLPSGRRVGLQHEESFGHNRATMGHPESPQSEFSKFLDVRLSELPAVDRKYFKYGSLLIGLSAATSGFLSSQVFRQTMKVRRGFLISSFIVTSLPLFQTTFIYQLAIPNTIMSDDLH